MTEKSLADRIRNGEYFECGDPRYGLNTTFIDAIADEVEALEEKLARQAMIARLSPRE